MHHPTGSRSDPGAPTGHRFRSRDTVDFVVIGAGSAGGVVARELARAGLTVVVLEQGPYLREGDFGHDEFAIGALEALTNNHHAQPNTFRTSEQEEAKPKPVVAYGRMVGGGSVHFTANYWRFHEIDFVERSRKGPVEGADLDDWPITYADLEPYYTRVEWEIGVSGQAGASPFDPPRSRPYPQTPPPKKPARVVGGRAAPQRRRDALRRDERESHGHSSCHSSFNGTTSKVSDVLMRRIVTRKFTPVSSVPRPEICKLHR